MVQGVLSKVIEYVQMVVKFQITLEAQIMKNLGEISTFYSSVHF